MRTRHRIGCGQTATHRDRGARSAGVWDHLLKKLRCGVRRPAHNAFYQQTPTVPRVSTTATR